MSPSSDDMSQARRTAVHIRCSSLDFPCSKLTVTDVTRLTGIICREKNYDAAMFGYIHAAMKYYLEVKAEHLKHSTGEDVVKYFRIAAPIAYYKLEKADALTIKSALRFRDEPKNGFIFPDFF